MSEWVNQMSPTAPPRTPRPGPGPPSVHTTVEMSSLWKPYNGFHRDLEISPTARDSHIPTADTHLMKGEENTNATPTAATRLLHQPAGGESQPRPQLGPAKIIVANRQE